MQRYSWRSQRMADGPQPRRASARKSTLRFRPQLELFERRKLLSTLTVINTLDSGKGSLRYEIAHANKNTMIDFAPSLNGQTITLTSGELAITTGVTIEGPGAGQLTISGGKNSRVFDVNASAPVVLSGLTISNGVENDGDGGGILNLSTLTLSGCVVSGNIASMPGLAYGAGIYNAGTLTLSGCTVSDNYTSGDMSAGLGGGIYNAGTLTVSSSTLSGDSAEGPGLVYPTGAAGGAIYNAGTLTVTNSTFTGNFADTAGGAIYNAGTLTVSNSTFNSTFSVIDGTYTESNIYGPYTDGGGNSFS